MKICFVSNKLTARLLRLKELYSNFAETNYIITDNIFSIEEFDLIILCTPFTKLLYETVKDKKVIIDLNGEQEPLVDMLLDKNLIITAPTKNIIDHYSNYNTGVVIEGIVDIYEKRTSYNKNSILVDLNYIEKSDLEQLHVNYKINALSVGVFENVSKFIGINFYRAMVTGELSNINIYKDCEFALFTTAINEQMTIPDTMVDCALIGIPIICTVNLIEARKFVLNHNCGTIIDRRDLTRIVSGEMKSVFTFNEEVIIKEKIKCLQ